MTSIARLHDTTLPQVSEVDPFVLRIVFEHFATGVVAITGVHPVTSATTGLVTNFSPSASLDPPLIFLRGPYDSVGTDLGITPR